MKSAVNDSPIATVFANLTGEIIYTNKAFLKMLGSMTQKKLIGRSFERFLWQSRIFHKLFEVRKKKQKNNRGVRNSQARW